MHWYLICPASIPLWGSDVRNIKSTIFVASVYRLRCLWGKSLTRRVRGMSLLNITIRLFPSRFWKDLWTDFVTSKPRYVLLAPSRLMLLLHTVVLYDRCSGDEECFPYLSQHNLSCLTQAARETYLKSLSKDQDGHAWSCMHHDESVAFCLFWSPELTCPAEWSIWRKYRPEDYLSSEIPFTATNRSS